MEATVKRSGLKRRLVAIGGLTAIGLTVMLMQLAGPVRKPEVVGQPLDAAPLESSIGAAGDDSLGGSGDQLLVAVEAGPTGLVAVGMDFHSQAINEDDTAVVWTSPDGIRWARAYSFPDAQVSDVAFHGPSGMLVAVGSSVSNGAVWVSPDGDNWERAATLDYQPGGGITLMAVAAAAQGLVAVGQELLGEGAAVPAAWTSTDGRAWQKAEVDAGLDDGGPSFSAMVDVTTTDRGWVAVGHLDDGHNHIPAVWTSPDGQHWDLTESHRVQTASPEALAVPGVALQAVAGDDDRLVTVGRTHAGGVPIWTSTDGGQSWLQARTDTDIPAGTDLRDVITTAGGWMAVGADTSATPNSTSGTGWTSEDGRTWSPILDATQDLAPSSDAAGVVITGAAARADDLVAVGYQGRSCTFLHRGCDLDATTWIIPQPWKLPTP